MGRKKKEKKPVTDQTSIEIGAGYIGTKMREESMLWRVAESNRLRDMIRRKVEGIPFDMPEEKKTKEQKKADMEKYKDEMLPKYLENLRKAKKLTTKELTRINTVKDIISDIKKLEGRATTELVEPYIVNEEMWYAYYKHIKGVGPVLAAELIQMMQPHGLKQDGTEICPHASSLRRYCMMDPDGARGREKGKKLTGNIQAKTLWWKVAKQMAMARNPTFTRLYEDEKERQLELMERGSCVHCGKKPEEHTKKKGDETYKCKDGEKYVPALPNAPMSLGHAHSRAIRNTLQKYITWHWIIDRQLNGYPTDRGYIFKAAEKPHDMSKFIPPEYIPDILKDENGNWDPERPPGWIFKVGHKDWNVASDYVKHLCAMEGINLGSSLGVVDEYVAAKKKADVIIQKMTDAALQGKQIKLTKEEKATLKQWETIKIKDQEDRERTSAAIQKKIHDEITPKRRGRPPKTLVEAQASPISTMKELQQEMRNKEQPKKRGRPRKMEQIPVEKKEKPKRGRPRKEA